MDYKDLICTNGNSNCFEKTEAGGAFFIFHQITDELSTKHDPACVQLCYCCNKIISKMLKPTEIQYSYKKQVCFTQQQKKSLKTLEKYGVNVNNFIRIAVKEKLLREWKTIKEDHEKIKIPF